LELSLVKDISRYWFGHYDQISANYWNQVSVSQVGPLDGGMTFHGKILVYQVADHQ